MKDELQILQDQMADVRKRIGEIQAEELKQENAKHVGKHFKVRNCFSCPKPDEYWWLYISITGMDEFGHLRGNRFQVDINGRAEVEINHPLISIRDGYIPITYEEFCEAWADMKAHLAKIEPSG